jgi:hypothetical protein
MLEGDYSSSESDDEQSSAASHVDLEQVVKAIIDLVGDDYSAKYSVSSSIEYNAEEYVPCIFFHEREAANQERQQALRQEKRVWRQAFLPSGIWLREINHP